MKHDEYDVAVVGAGPGGYVAAIRAAQLGLRTVVVEKAELGGICLNWGCIPTKALLRSAEVLQTARHAVRFGVRVHDVQPDLAAMVERSRDVARQLEQGVGYLLKKSGVEHVRARASLEGPGRLRLADAQDPGKAIGTIRAAHIVLATGARARILPDLPPDPENLWYYREALVPSRVPERLLIIGAGAIGIEFACFYRALGSEVHVLEMADRVLPAEDAEISEHMASALRKQGVALHLGQKYESIRRAQDVWTVVIQGGESVDVDVILAAAGVVGNVEGLGLENTAVRLDGSHVVTGPFGQTDAPGIYAIGDLASGPCLAHKASHQAVLCIEHIAGLSPQALDMDRIPACTYSHPQVAHVGLTEAQARSRGHDVRVGRFPFKANGKAIAQGSTEGFVKIVMSSATGELLGAHMIGEGVTEMIQGPGLAMTLETTEEELLRTVFAHPTQSEAIHEAVLSAYDRALHI